MKKNLSDMTNEELWRLFPVILKKHNPAYQQWYEEEFFTLVQITGPHFIIRINHIGSSAVAGLISKPTIDILMEIDGACLVSDLEKQLASNGWGLMRRESEPAAKWIFYKGYMPEGFEEKVYHLHVRYYGDWDELYFRDYLIGHPEVAEKYGELKLRLLGRYGNNRDGYTQAKTEFIEKHTYLARQQFQNRYKPD